MPMQTVLAALTRPWRAVRAARWAATVLVAAAVVPAGDADAQRDTGATAATGGTVLTISDGVAPVTRANTRRRPDGGFDVLLAPEPARARLPVVDPELAAPWAGMLRRLHRAGRAAGLAGVIYDNRDRGHSSLRPGLFPQLSRSGYASEFTTENLDTGTAGPFRFPLPVIGNSSTALRRSPLGRSHGRLALQGPEAAARTHALYAANHLYVYPEHRDHDPGTGDRLFALSPAFVLSQGSSGSDRPFMRTLAMIHAAFAPETRSRLEQEGLLAATAQMVLRRNLRGVGGGADYLSAKAHPPVFSKEMLRPEAMVAHANAVAADAIPPMVQLAVVKDFAAVPGRDYLAGNLGEAVFTTPTAVARLWRSFAYRREITLSAEGTRDPNGRPLEFHWVLLRGDPERVRITPLEGSPARARIELEWHGGRWADPVTGLATSRIDIGVFADNGVHLSAPSFLSVALPPHQDRRYRSGPDGRERLVALDYRSEPEGPYVDPLIWPVAGWADRLVRRPDGTVTAFERTEDGGTRRVSGEELRHLAVPDSDGVLRLHAESPPRSR